MYVHIWSATLNVVSSPDLIRHVYRLQYNPSFPTLDTESDPRWGWFWVWDRDYTKCAHTVLNHDIVPVVGVVFVEGDMEEANVPKQQ